MATVRGALLVALAACANPTPPPVPPAGDVSPARVFAPGVVSSGDAIAPAFAPDGRTIYFVKTGRTRTQTRLMMARRDGAAWTAPRPAPFGDPGATELSPFVAPDGAVYFASNRPRAPGDTRSDLDLWVARATPDGFVQPVHVDAPIDSTAIEVGPSLTADGTLYFTSGRSGPPGIYRAARARDGFAAPERLPAAVNMPGGYTSTPFIAPDESYLLFYFQPVGDAGIGEADLYVSWRRGTTWSAAVPLGPAVNTAGNGEFSPTITPDGRTLYFARNQVRSFEPDLDIAWEDIFYVPVTAVAALRQPP